MHRLTSLLPLILLWATAKALPRLQTCSQLDSCLKNRCNLAVGSSTIPRTNEVTASRLRLHGGEGISPLLGTAVAVASALSVNLGKVCQKRGTQELPLLELKSDVVHLYLSNLWWISGLLMDVGGALMTIAALAMAPVSVVQPILGCGPGIVAVSSSVLTNDALRPTDWLAAGLCVGGTVGIGLTAAETKASSNGGTDFSLSKVAGLVLAFIGCAAACELLARSGALPLHVASSVAAGVCFGLSACCTRCGLTLAGPLGPAAPLAGIAGSVVLSSSGFIAQTRGLKGGRALSVVTYSNLVALLSAVLFGVLALDEPLPSSTAGRVTRGAALGLLCVASYLLQL